MPPRGPRNESGHVCHVYHEVGADAVGDVAESFPVEHARIGGETRNDQLWFVVIRDRLDLVIVDERRVVIDAVLRGVIQATREIDLGAVCQVPALRETHTEQAIAGIEERHAYGGICL